MNKKCIEAWLDEIRPFGHILEIGGKTALPLQPFRPSSYTRIESWQTDLSPLGTFDWILYNGEPIEKAHVETGSLLLKEGKKVVQGIQEMIPQLSKIRYTDRDLDAFREQMGAAQKPYLSRFLSELLESGQITESQYERQVEKGGLKKSVPPKATAQEDTLFECIQECLRHMLKGARFSCLIGAASKYEDPRFFEHIIANPSLDYQEKMVGTAQYLLIEKL